MLIDTHCHINFPDKFPDVAQTLNEARAAGVGQVIAVGCDMDSNREALRLAKLYDEVFAVVGWHPTYVKDYSKESLLELEQMLAEPKVVALGEIGLDFHWDYTTPEEQWAALVDQLDLAVRLDCPVVFHCRKAYPDLLTLLESRPTHRYLLHCFAGDVEDARRATALGCYFGVDGPITYKNSGNLRDVISTLPQDRLVIETDSPYMPPEPHRGKPNSPAWVRFVNEGLAKCLGISAKSSEDLTTANAMRFFNLPA